ncbi:MAG: pyruvate, water dikinase regulatory protein [Thermaurantiacus sp.]
MPALQLHLVSDSTGETLEQLAKAGLAQFDDVDLVKHYWPMVRSEGHLDRVLDEISERPGLVLYTLVGSRLRARLEARCAALGLPVIAVLDPVIAGLSRVLGRPARETPGIQHTMDAAYFRRMEAIHYTMAHDDGQGMDGWHEADVILMGVSRSSKTPTSVYLANRGWKTANMPLVPGRPLPPVLDQIGNGPTGPLVVGLTVSPERLVEVRRQRVLGQAAGVAQLPPGREGDHYVDPDRVRAEVLAARRMLTARGWPVIDVTRRSIEETAAAVINLLNQKAETLRERAS